MSDSRNQWDAGGPFQRSVPPPVATFDPEIGQIFLKMRNLLGLTLWDMARAVGGEPTAIADLEAGAIGSLPPWPELSRLIGAYVALTGVDATPIVNRILRSRGEITQQWSPQPAPGPPPSYRAGQHSPMGLRGPVYDHGDALVRTARRAVTLLPAHDITPPVPAPSRTPAHSRRETQALLPAPAPVAAVAPAVEQQARTRALRKSGASTLRGIGRLVRRRAGTMIVCLLLPVTLLLTARLAPNVLYAAAAPLPSVVRAPLRQGIDTVVDAIAPLRDGLTWIDVGDPRIRKADKLPDRRR